MEVMKLLAPRMKIRIVPTILYIVESILQEGNATIKIF